MSEFSTHRSGGRVQEISRQFTEPERVIDERVSNHLKAPMPEMANVAPSTAYAWLEKDLDLRDRVGRTLAAERGLADAQSVRQEMDRKFTQDTEDDAETIGALKTINELRSANPDLEFSQAAAIAAKDKPHLWMNKSFTGALKEAGPMHETDLAIRAKRDALRVTANTSALNVMSSGERLSFYNSPEGQDHLTMMAESARSAERHGAELAPLQQEALRLKTEMEVTEVKDKKAQLEAAGPAGSRRAHAVAAGMFRDAGVTLTNPGRVADFIRGDADVAEMALDSVFMRSLPEADRAALAGALDTYTAEKATPEEKDAANGIINNTLSDHLTYRGEAKLRLAQKEEFETFGSEIGKSAKEGRAFFNDLRGQMAKPAEGTTDKTPLSPHGDTAIEWSESAVKDLASRYNASPALVKKYQDRVKAAWGKADNRERINEAQDIHEEFTSELMKEKKTADTRAPASTKAAPATDRTAKALGYMKAAGGDKNKARALAKADGFEF